MSAYKQLTTKDVVITPFWANKGFTFQGASVTASDAGIEYYYGQELPKLNTTQSASIPIGTGLINQPGGAYDLTAINPSYKDKDAFYSNFYYYWVLTGYNTFYYSSSLFQTGFNTKRNIFTVYNNVKQLYYTNFLTRSYGDLVATRSFYPNLTGNPSENVSYGSTESPLYENFLMNTLPPTRSFIGAFKNEDNVIAPDLAVISIPQKLYGEAIEPGSFSYQITGSYSNGAVINTRFFVDLRDDQEGNILASLSSSHYHDGAPGAAGGGYYKDKVMGNIIYPHGMVIVSDAGLGSNINERDPSLENNSQTASLSNLVGLLPNAGITLMSTAGLNNDCLNSSSVSFSSSYKVYEHQYKCTIRENEFGYSLNPTLLSGSDGKNNLVYYDYATSSYFSPYITTVGLYNKNKELVAVGKLSKATKMPMESDLTIQINFDI